MLVDWKPISYTANFATVSGVKGVQFLLSSDFTGTIAGVSFPGGAWTVIPADAPDGGQLAPINVVVTTGTVVILYKN